MDRFSGLFVARRYHIFSLARKKKQRPRFMLRTFMFNENLPARDTSVSTRQHHVLKKMTHRT